jgi:hypothetical protein
MDQQKVAKLKKWGLIIVIGLLVVVGIIAGVSYMKKRKDKKILEQEKEKIEGLDSGSSHAHSSHSSQTQPAGSGAASGPKTTSYKDLKPNDKLWAVGVTNLYKDAQLTQMVLQAPAGNYVGQLISGYPGPLKVQLYDYTGPNIGYVFYLAPKDYIVKD